MCPPETEAETQARRDALLASLVLDLAGGYYHHRNRRRDYMARAVARYILESDEAPGAAPSTRGPRGE